MLLLPWKSEHPIESRIRNENTYEVVFLPSGMACEFILVSNQESVLFHVCFFFLINIIGPLFYLIMISCFLLFFWSYSFFLISFLVPSSHISSSLTRLSHHNLRPQSTVDGSLAEVAEVTVPLPHPHLLGFGGRSPSGTWAATGSPGATWILKNCVFRICIFADLTKGGRVGRSREVKGGRGRSGDDLTK